MKTLRLKTTKLVQLLVGSASNLLPLPQRNASNVKSWCSLFDLIRTHVYFAESRRATLTNTYSLGNGLLLFSIPGSKLRLFSRSACTNLARATCSPQMAKTAQQHTSVTRRRICGQHHSFAESVLMHFLCFSAKENDSRSESHFREICEHFPPLVGMLDRIVQSKDHSMFNDLVTAVIKTLPISRVSVVIVLQVDFRRHSYDNNSRLWASQIWTPRLADRRCRRVLSSCKQQRSPRQEV